MKTKLLSESNNELQLEVSDATPSQMNSLRRAAMFKVQTLAIEDVYITENSSALFDEQIAARLGLLVLKANVDKMTPSAKCKCKGKGCKNCQAKLTVSAVGPKTVYASDLTIENAEIVHPKTPIVWLEEGQKIDISATACLGIGEDHAKWNTGLVYYHHYPQITIKNKAALTKLISKSPFSKVFDSKLNIKDRDYDLAILCEEKSTGVLSVKSNQSKFILNLESWGQLKPKDILKKAVAILKIELNELKLK
jgi:DNA-directed RNA polymerase subunit D